MENRVRKHVDNLFRTFKQDDQTLDTKEELISNLLDRINDNVENGKSENDAFNDAVGNLGTKSELRKIFNFKNISDYSMEYSLNGKVTLMVTAVYLVLGFVFSMWHPGWVIYIVALAFSKLNINDKKSYFIPIVSLIYVFIGFMWDFWNPGWIIFPIAFVIYASMEKKTGALWVMTTAIYIMLGVLFSNWLIFSALFLLAAALVVGKDEPIGAIWLLTIGAYLVLGFAFDYWHPGWLVFGAAIALSTLISENSLVGFMWVSVIFGYLAVGFIAGMWHPTWIVFIAAVAISAYIENDEIIEIKDLSEEDNL